MRLKRIDADVVCENDEFVYVKGTEPVLRFVPKFGTRGKRKHVYALVEFKSGGIQSDVMSYEEVNHIRNMAKSKDSDSWKYHWDEMAKKTVFSSYG
ncbi:recombination and repair protein RecT [Poriferisphaera corsica]|uniref:Recombination and repair protein RecT n=1 Tax=Poriferisphaera corsica TaxID=2528020 RepID=A0A517YVQ7_9BACT|nr:recombinase RecT [Poriferisphaera corsica]QDU34314.1 recombination and repair protein RecT [Poriferisphaera corsica]